MTDTLNVTGGLVSETAPVESAIPETSAPNGFVELGLAPELIQAVADLG